VGRFGWIYPGILTLVAKVMVSMPDDLLAEVDAEALRSGTSRSAVLREFAFAALRRRREDRAAVMKSLLEARAPHGGGAAEQVKATRPSDR
jgi:metal-responsive CopG/Arc/MetJ family transcriptional regulator